MWTHSLNYKGIFKYPLFRFMARIDTACPWPHLVFLWLLFALLAFLSLPSIFSTEAPGRSKECSYRADKQMSGRGGILTWNWDAVTTRSWQTFHIPLHFSLVTCKNFPQTSVSLCDLSVANISTSAFWWGRGRIRIWNALKGLWVEGWFPVGLRSEAELCVDWIFWHHRRINPLPVYNCWAIEGACWEIRVRGL